jgi:membrane fusion protein (multidrug efflux system)
LIAFQQVDLYAKVSSFVKKLHVDVGTEVQQGPATCLHGSSRAYFPADRQRIAPEIAEALYQASKANYDRLLETSKTPGTVSQNDLDVALAKKNAPTSPN